MNAADNIKFPVRDWKEAVASGYTMQGYAEWVREQARIEKTAESPVSAADPKPE